MRRGDARTLWLNTRAPNLAPDRLSRLLLHAGIALEADFELRDVKLEQREQQIVDLQQRLAKKETDLSQYVGQLQSEMDRRESDWWEKQLGKKPAPAGD